MATVRPFKAVRPAAGYADKIAALPYDVMSSEEAREMVKGSPLSFLHIDKAEIDLPPGIDPYDPRVYAKAAETMAGMVRDGYFIQDAEPNFYIYALTMDGRTQTGLVACTSIDEYLDGTIKRHELTREDKECDRIRHVEALCANTGPVFLAYRADAGISAIINGLKNGLPPVYDFTSDDGVRHRAWVVSDSGIITELSALFERVPNLYIADGHHRNAAGVKAGLDMRAENPDSSAEHNYYLAVLFPSDELLIMDYNRVVTDLNGMSEGEFIEKIGGKFNVVKSEDGKPDKRHKIGMYLGGQWYMLEAKPEIVTDDPIDALDVSILQNNVLKPLLGIDDPRTSHRIDFVGGIRGIGELKRRVDSQGGGAAFAMRATSLDELFDVADSGKIMPPKSTWFEPKLRSGLFIHKLTD